MKKVFEKLNIKAHYQVAVVNSPQDYYDLVQADNAQFDIVSLQENPQLVHLFTKSLHELEERFPELKTVIPKDGALWISWPKAKSKIPRDLNENDIRATGLALGLVDNKVCSINEDWSALRFVYRLKDR